MDEVNPCTRCSHEREPASQHAALSNGPQSSSSSSSPPGLEDGIMMIDSDPNADYPSRVQKKQKTMYEYSEKEDDGTSVTMHSESDMLDVESIRKAISSMIMVDKLPFSMVEGQGFRQLIEILEPRFTVPCRDTVIADCVKLYEKEKREMKRLLINRRLSLTADCWTSIQDRNYLILVAHFMDDNWKIQKRILNLCLVEDHKGETIGRTIESCLIEWGFDKVSTITVDNASSNDEAIEHLQMCNWRDEVILNKYLHVRCAAHTINLIVVEGLREQFYSIQRIRNAVRYVRSSPQRIKKFQECVELEKVECKEDICLDVESGWNSTYLMLDTAIKYKNAFNRLKMQDSSYALYFDGGYGEESETNSDFDVALGERRNVLIGPPEKDDWAKAEAFVNLLGPFYDSILAFSGSNSITPVRFCEQFLSMHLTIKEMQGSSDTVAKNMADSMLEKFERYESSCRNNLMFLVVVFDPRYKFRYIEFFFEEMYGENVLGSEGISVTLEGAQLMKDIKSELEALFKFYMDQYTSEETAANIEECTSSDHRSLREHVRRFMDFQFQEKLQRANSELTRYLHDSCERVRDLDILEWWKLNSSRYPVLSVIAKEVLAIPVATFVSEQPFSTCGKMVYDFRSSLKPKTMEMLVCSHNWFRSSNDQIDLRGILEDFQKYEQIVPLKDIEKYEEIANGATASRASVGT